MLRPRLNITFITEENVSVEFRFCKGFEIDESYEGLTGRCSITLSYEFFGQAGSRNLFAGEKPIFKRGDRVIIKAGYYPKIVTVFDGYIANVNANLPIEIQCEDAMFLLKKYTFNIPSKVPLITKSKNGKFLKRPKVDTSKIANISLNELLDIIIPDDIDFVVVDDIKLGKFRCSNATPAMILDKIKEQYGLYSYFVDDVLYVGFASNALETTEFILDMEEVVINSNDLFYKRSEDIQIKVRATSMNDQNVKTTIETGNPEGEQRDYHYYNLTLSQLDEIAKKRLSEAKYTGFFGTLETFFYPYVRHGDIVTIKSRRLPERDGTYIVKSVKRIIDVRMGGRQFLELGAKIG